MNTFERSIRDHAAWMVRRAIANQLSTPIDDVIPEHELERDLALTSLDIVLISLGFGDDAHDFPVETLQSVVTVGDVIDAYTSWLCFERNISQRNGNHRLIVRKHSEGRRS